MASLLERRDAVQRAAHSVYTPRLDNLERMQREPFNTEANRPLSPNAYGGAAGANYRRMTESYGRALRQLRRASRRGDTGAALKEIAVREDAMNKGYAHTGGIRRSEDYNRDRETWQGAMEQEAEDAGMEREANRRRIRGELDWRAPRTETGGASTAEGQLGYDPYAPAEMGTGGSGTAESQVGYDPYAPAETDPTVAQDDYLPEENDPFAKTKPKKRGFFPRLFRQLGMS